MRTKLMRAVAALAAVALAIACSSDDGTGPEEASSPINASESLAMANTMMGAMSETFASGSQQSVALSGGESIPININYSHAQACPGGGTLSLSGSASGSLDTETGTGSVFVQVLETANDCGFGFTERQVIINTAPTLSATGTFSFVGGQLGTQQTVRVGGGFNFQIDGATTGFCAVNLTVNLSPTPGGTTTSGTVCGHQVNFSV